jgi:hypothetical protein
MMNSLWELIKTLAAIAILAAISWLAYTLWNPAPDDDEAVPGASFNCRKALADLATGYSCRDSASCNMSNDELADLNRLEASINEYCD